MDRYLDRYDAGKILATFLIEYRQQKNVIVLALPRGGVPVGYEVAKYLSVPLDIFVVRKLGVPGYPELAMGAIASGETVVFNQDILKDLQLPRKSIDRVIELEKEELQRREMMYRGSKPFPNLMDKTIILVDDGVATGATMHVAVNALQRFQPIDIIIAVPVCAYSVYQEMEKWGYKMICPLIKTDFRAVGLWYDHFEQTSDEEVFRLLSEF